jgi:hypothetical protein
MMERIGDLTPAKKYYSGERIKNLREVAKTTEATRWSVYARRLHQYRTEAKNPGSSEEVYMENLRIGAAMLFAWRERAETKWEKRTLSDRIQHIMYEYMCWMMYDQAVYEGCCITQTIENQIEDDTRTASLEALKEMARNHSRAMEHLEWDFDQLLEDAKPEHVTLWEESFEAAMKERALLTKKNRGGSTARSETTKASKDGSMARGTATPQPPKEQQASGLGSKRGECVHEEYWSDDSMESASQTSRRTRTGKKKQEANFVFHQKDGRCTGCGVYKEHSSHRTLSCTYSNYKEWFNPDKNIPWVESKQCKAYRARFGEKEMMISPVDERKRLEKAVKLRAEAKRRSED